MTRYRATFRGHETPRGNSGSQTELETGDRPVDLDEVRRAECDRQASSPGDASEPAASRRDAVGSVVVKRRESVGLIAEHAHSGEADRIPIGRGHRTRSGDDVTDSTRPVVRENNRGEKVH